jgi:DNA-binding transcriptional LysR family regulator
MSAIVVTYTPWIIGRTHEQDSPARSEDRRQLWECQSICAMQCFLAVAAAGSISRAAETLHIAQPALEPADPASGRGAWRHAVHAQPQRRGADRGGQRFEIHARDILKRLDIACEDVRDLMVDPEGSVAIGLPQSMAKILTVPIVREVIRRWPKVRLQVIELSTGYIPGHLLSGHIDIGLTFRAHANSGLQFDQIVDEDLVLVGPPGQFANGHTQAQPLAETVRLRDLNRYPMILPAGEHGLRALLDGYLRTQGVDLQILAEVNAIPELIALASAGVGCTVLRMRRCVPKCERASSRPRASTSPPYRARSICAAPPPCPCLSPRPPYWTC